MANIISYNNIRTNNLKDVCLKIKIPSFIGISGPSGSGKSSLAFGTMYGVAREEWDKISGDDNSGKCASYKLESFSNVVPAIALFQDNYNVNPRSTIGTYFHIDRIIRLLFAANCNIPPSFFSFNNPKSSCPYCEGLGFEHNISENDIIDWSTPINESPFKPWKGRYQQKVLEKYALSLGVPLTTPLSKLSLDLVDKFLYHETTDRFRVSYKIRGKNVTREFRYIGVLRELNSLKEDRRSSSAQKVEKYVDTQVCSHCLGSRFADHVLRHKIFDYSIGDIYMMEIDELCSLTKSWISNSSGQRKIMLKSFYSQIKSISDSRLGYLHLNRSIPSLSGGELQRLRLVRILSSQVSGMMYVFDEPSAHLHSSEYPYLVSSLKSLRDRGNVVVIVEHNPIFLSETDENVYLGPGSGPQGGCVVCPTEEKTSLKYQKKRSDFFLPIYPITDNNLKNVSVRIPKGCITVIFGPCGSGKSTLLRNIEKQLNRDCVLINQSPLRGSFNSFVATYCGVMDDIREFFAFSTKVDRDYFSCVTAKGACPSCNGRGYLKYSLDFGKMESVVECEDCQGMRFSKDAMEYYVNGKNIYEILSVTIDELISSNFFSSSQVIFEKLTLLQKLGLGHLSLFRTTDTLSGGESQRLKLSKALCKSRTKKVFMFDEPFRGLSQSDIEKIVTLFSDLTKRGSTVVFIEHNPVALTFCDYLVEMGPGMGKKGGKIVFEGWN